MSRSEPLHAHRQDVAYTTLGVALGLLLDLTEATPGIVLGLVLDLLEQHLFRARGRQSRYSLERLLELAAGLAELPLLSFELSFPASERDFAAVEVGVVRGQRIVVVPGTAGPSPGRYEPGAMHASVHERGEHDSHRDQRCGTDDFHGRSSPGGPGGPDLPHTALAFGSDRAARARRTNGCRARRLAPFARQLAGGFSELSRRAHRPDRGCRQR